MFSTSPSEQKTIGRELDLDRKAWNQTVKWEVQLTAVRAKFRQNPHLAAKLLATGQKPIGEASPTDRVFGIGLAPSNKEAQDVKNWRGTNLLGEALMTVRAELRDFVLERSGCATSDDSASDDATELRSLDEEM